MTVSVKRRVYVYAHMHAFVCVHMLEGAFNFYSTTDQFSIDWTTIYFVLVSFSLILFVCWFFNFINKPEKNAVTKFVLWASLGRMLPSVVDDNLVKVFAGKPIEANATEMKKEIHANFEKYLSMFHEQITFSWSQFQLKSSFKLHCTYHRFFDGFTFSTIFAMNYRIFGQCLFSD